MIQAVGENKYCFNMQVSAEAMAAFRSTAGATTFDERVQLIGYQVGIAPGATFRDSADGNRQQSRQAPELRKPVLCSAMPLAWANRQRRRTTVPRPAGRPSACVMAAYSIRICAGHRFRRVLRRAASAPAA
jgi:hypothetical protein